MLITTTRIRRPGYTISKLNIDGIYFCDVLEDQDRGLDSTMPLADIRARKVAGATAIPTGTYTITLDVVSPKFSQYKFYKEFCGGKLPRILNVPGFDGILIHGAISKLSGEEKTATPDWTDGCLLVGQNKVVGGLINTKQTFIDFYNKLSAAVDAGETITLIIK